MTALNLKDHQPEPENGHVRLGARQAIGIAGAVLLGVGTWAVADHVRFKGEAVGRLTAVETTQARDTKIQTDHEGRLRSLEARLQEDLAEIKRLLQAREPGRKR
jgi:hypothetical protein